MRTADSNVFDQRLPHAPAKSHTESRPYSDGLGSQHLRMQHLGIPLRLIPYIDHEVEHLLGGRRDLDHVLDSRFLKHAATHSRSLLAGLASHLTLYPSAAGPRAAMAEG